MSVSRHAYAKVNLALAVGPPLAQDDPNHGMHPIASWMHAIDLADTLTVERVDQGVHLDIDWAWDASRPTPIDWPAEKDLCVRAALALSDAVSMPVNVRISVEKRIPVGAGLGGGSSDAAATFLALDELFQFNLPLERLREISATIGSDIAFFLDTPNPPRPAIVTGLGDEIDRLERDHPGAQIRAGTELMLCIPPFGCATGAVYRAFDALDPPCLRDEEVRSLAASNAPGGLFNDLAAAADRVAPDLPILRASIAEILGAPVHVTGSGSAMFAFARGDGLEILRRSLPQVAFITTRLI